MPQLEAMLGSARHHGCELEVEVHHVGDLSSASRTIIRSLGATIVNTPAVSGLNPEALAGYAIKPHAVAASRFAEVLLVDADALFFAKPELAFGQRGYRKTGTLLFSDRDFEERRLRRHRRGMRWLARHLDPAKLAPIRHRRHVIDSGLVAWDHGRVPAQAIDFACALNRPPLSQDFHRHFHGDKESFWIGLMKAGHPAAISPSIPGAIRARDLQTGRVVHVRQMLHHVPDSPTERFWCQGGNLARNKGTPRVVTYDACTGPDLEWTGSRRFRGGELRMLDLEERALIDRLAAGVRSRL